LLNEEVNFTIPSELSRIVDLRTRVDDGIVTHHGAHLFQPSSFHLFEFVGVLLYAVLAYGMIFLVINMVRLAVVPCTAPEYHASDSIHVVPCAVAYISFTAVFANQQQDSLRSQPPLRLDEHELLFTSSALC